MGCSGVSSASVQGSGPPPQGSDWRSEEDAVRYCYNSDTEWQQRATGFLCRKRLPEMAALGARDDFPRAASHLFPDLLPFADECRL